MADLGPAFDTNVLNTPTPRRLMSLWMECAELPPQRVRAATATPCLWQT